MRVARFHGFLGGRGAQQADAAGGVRAIVGNAGFAEQRFDDRRRQRFGELLQFGGRRQSAAAGENDDLLARVENLGGAAQVLLSTGSPALNAGTSEV